MEQGINTNLDAQEILGTDTKEPAQSSEDFGNVQPTQEQPASVVPIPDSTDDKQGFDPQPLIQEYLSKFQKDLDSYIISSQSQEDTMERINRVSNALHNMGVDPKILALSLKYKMDENKDIHKKDDDDQDNGLAGGDQEFTKQKTKPKSKRHLVTYVKILKIVHHLVWMCSMITNPRRFNLK